MNTTETTRFFTAWNGANLCANCGALENIDRRGYHDGETVAHPYRCAFRPQEIGVCDGLTRGDGYPGSRYFHRHNPACPGHGFNG